MKRINSIYRIFVLFLAIIVVSFLILYCYSTINLKTSLRRVAKIQMEYSYDQLEQKIKEIELEASSILTREETKLLQVAIVDNEDIYSYVMKVKTMQEIFQEKQKTNSGMAEFDLYWPEEQRIVSSTTITSIKGKKILDQLQDNQWIISENEVYFCRHAVGDTVKAVTVEGVECSEDTVKDGTYKIQRPFVFVTNDSAPLSEQAQAFFDFATSTDAADLIRTAGAVPVNE